MAAMRRKRRRLSGTAVLLVTFVLIICVFFAVRIRSLMKIDQEYAQKESEALREYILESERSAEIQESMDYIKSREYVEDQATTKLRLDYPEEVKASIAQSIEQAEQERIAQEQAEQERIAQEQAEQERIAQEQAEQERIAQEQAEQERIAQEQAEQERIAQEQAEQERIAQEQAEQEQIAQEQTNE